MNGYFERAWRHVHQRGRCEGCGELIAAGWFFYVSPALYTHAVCDACATQTIRKGKP